MARAARSFASNRLLRHGVDWDLSLEPEGVCLRDAGREGYAAHRIRPTPFVGNCSV